MRPCTQAVRAVPEAWGAKHPPLAHVVGVEGLGQTCGASAATVRIAGCSVLPKQDGAKCVMRRLGKPTARSQACLRSTHASTRYQPSLAGRRRPASHEASQWLQGYWSQQSPKAGVLWAGRGQGISVTAHERAQGAMLHGVGKWELVIGTHVVRMPEAASVGACEQSTRVPPAGCSSMLWLPLRLHCWRTGRVVYAMLSAATCLQLQHHTHPCHTCSQHLRPARR